MDVLANQPATDNQAIALRFYELFDTEDMTLIERVLATDWIEYPPSAPNQAPGREGFKPIITGFRQTFPDVRFEVKDVIFQGNKVVVRSVIHGTHQGQFMQFPATGKRVAIDAIDIHRLENGAIVETWHVEDRFGLLQQIGVVT